LPGLAVGEVAAFFQRREAFRQQAASCIAGLWKELLAFVAGGVDTVSDSVTAGLSETVAALQEEIVNGFPAGEGTTVDLEVHRLPGVTVARLLAGSCPEVEEPVEKSLVSGLLAVVKARQ
jgi:hypothetical protein